MNFNFGTMALDTVFYGLVFLTILTSPSRQNGLKPSAMSMQSFLVYLQKSSYFLRTALHPIALDLSSSFHDE